MTILTSESINELAASLAKAQAVLQTMPKSASGYGYRYTPLDVVIEAIRAPLASAGLSYVQMPVASEAGSVALVTRLMHTSGQWIESTLAIPVPQVGKSNSAQCYGAALTYARRYALTAMLGLAAEEDVDAAGIDRQPSRKEQEQAADQAQARTDRDQRNREMAKQLAQELAETIGDDGNLARDIWRANKDPAARVAALMTALETAQGRRDDEAANGGAS